MKSLFGQTSSQTSYNEINSSENFDPLNEPTSSITTTTNKNTKQNNSDTNKANDSYSLIGRLANLFQINATYKDKSIFSSITTTPSTTSTENIVLEAPEQPEQIPLAMTSRVQAKMNERIDYLQPDQRFIYIDYALTSDETTLQSVSMKFAVPIQDLRRINCLQNDRDMFALKTLKIPIKPNSVLAEKVSKLCC
jgi:hypothetical protein